MYHHRLNYHLPMTKPLLAILLLLPLSVSAADEAPLLTGEEARAALEDLWQGELDGKAFICENEGENYPIRSRV